MPSLRRTALRLAQHPEYPLYLFSLQAREVLQVADIARVSRDDAGTLIGYQRPAVRRHIRDILNYLNSGDVLFPAALVIAFTSEVQFMPRVGRDHGPAGSGVLEIPLRTEGPKPGFIVDGQQRALALSESSDPDFPVPVSAFIADNPEVQREQFIRVNSVRPLPKTLVTELLPTVEAAFPAKLERRRVPSVLVDRLAQELSSPFYGMVRRPSTPTEERRRAVVADTSLVRAIQRSLSTPTGALFAFQNLAAGTVDFDRAYRLLCVFWTAVRATFPKAWGLPPHESRLMHGVGIQALGRFMDRAMGLVDPETPEAKQRAERALRLIAPHCAWTGGCWEGLAGLPWDGLQNNSSHVRLLAEHLTDLYVQADQHARIAAPIQQATQ